MADSYDERVVSMRFDNAQFEKGIKKSTQSIEDLKKSLDFSKTEKDLSSFEQSFESFSETTKESSSSLLGIFESLKHNLTESGQKAEGFVKSIAKIRIINNTLKMLEQRAKQLGNILGVNQIANLATNLENVTAGLEKYERKISATKTITNATGLDSKTVDAQLDRLNWFTDETSANFAEMVENIGKFTSVGRGLDESITAMEGIATWGYQSGASIEQMNRAMYNLSQAMGTGSVKLIDWKSIENAGMATKEFKEQAIAAAEAAGTLKRKGDKLYTAKGNKEVNYSNFNSTLQQGWFTSDVLMSTLKQYGEFASKVQSYQEKHGLDNARDAINAMDAERLQKRTKLLDEFSKKSGKTNEELLKQARKINEIDDPKKRAAAVKTFAAEMSKLGVSASEVDRLLKGVADTEETLAEKAFKASQESKSFKDSINATKDAISTGWMKSFQYIFGDLEGSIKTWTGVTDVLWDLFASSAQSRNDALKSWAEAFNGRADLFDFDYRDQYGNLITDLSQLEDMDSVEYSTGAIRALADAILAIKEAISGGIQDTFFPDLAGILGDPKLTAAEEEQERFATKIQGIYESKDKFVSAASIKTLEEAGALTDEMKENMIKAAVKSGELIEKNGKYYTKKGNVEVNTDNILETMQKRSWLTQEALKGLLETNTDTAGAIDGIWTEEERKRYRRAKYFGEKIKNITGMIKDFANKIRNFFEDAENSSNIRKLFGGIASIVKLIGSIVKAVTTAVGGFLSRTKILEKILSFLGGLGEKVSESINKFLASGKLEKVSKFIEDVLVGIVDAISWVIGLFSGWYKAIKEFFSENGIGAMISDFFTRIKETLFGKKEDPEKTDPGGLGALLNWLKGLKEKFEKFDLKAALNKVLNGLRFVKQFFSAKNTINTDGLSEGQKKIYKVLEVFEKIFNKMKGLWVRLKAMYYGFKVWLNKSGITPFIKEKWAALKAKFTTISSEVQQISFIDGLKRVWGKIKEVFNEIRNFLQRIGLIDFINSKWEALKNAVKNFNIYELKDKLLGVKEDIKNGGLLDKIKEKWESFKEWLKGLGLEDLGKSIGDAASKMWDKILSIFVGSAKAEDFAEDGGGSTLIDKAHNQMTKLKSMVGMGDGGTGEKKSLGKLASFREKLMAKLQSRKKNKNSTSGATSSSSDSTFSLLDDFKEKWNKFKTWVKGIDWEKVSTIFGNFSGGLAKIIAGLAIFKGAKSLTKAGEGIGEGLKSFSGLFKNLTEGVNSFLKGKAEAEKIASEAKLEEAKNSKKKDTLGTTLLKIAGAVAILAVAVKLISDIEPEKLKNGLMALAGIAVILAAIVLVVGGLQKLLQVDVGSSIMKIAGAIIVLAIAAWMLRDINAARMLAIGVAMKIMMKALTDIMTSLAKTSMLMDKAKTKSLKKTSTQAIKIALAMVILAKACGELAKYNIAQIAKGVLGIKTLLKALADAMKTIGESKNSVVKSGPIIAMAISVWILSKVVKQLAVLDVKDALKGVAGVSILLSRLGKAMKKANSGAGSVAKGTAIIAMALSVAILTRVVKRLAEMNLSQALKGIVLLELILSRFSAAIKKANSGKGTKAGALAVLAMGIAVRLMLKVIKELANMPLKDGLKGTISLGIILSSLGKAIKKANSGKGTKTGILTIIGMALAVKILSKVVKDLGKLKVSEALKGIASISILMKQFSKMINKTSLSGADSKHPFLSTLGNAVLILAMAKSMSMLADACKKLGELNGKTLLKGVAALTAVIKGFSSLSKSLSSGKARLGKALVLILTMGASLYMVADVFKGMQDVNMDPGVKFAAAISAILLSLGKTFELLDGISFGSVLASMLKLVAVIAIIAGLVAAIGAVCGDGVEVMKLFEQGGNILESLGIAIGRGIGGLIAGIGLSISDALPTIGTNIRSFMDCFKGMKDPGLIVSDKTVTGFTNLFKIIAMMAGAEIIEAITNFLLGYGDKVDDTTGEIVSSEDMFTHFVGIIQQLNGMFTELRGMDFTLKDFKIDEDAGQKMGSLMQVIAAIAGTDLITAIGNWVTGLFQGEDKKDIFEQFSASMTSLKGLFTQLAGIGPLSLGSFSIEDDAPTKILSMLGVIAAVATTDLITSISNWVTGLFQGGDDKKDLFDQFAGTIASTKTLFDNLSAIGPLSLGKFSIEEGAAGKIADLMGIITAVATTDLVSAISEWVTGLFQGEGEKKNIFDQFAESIASTKTLFDNLSAIGPLSLGNFSIESDAAEKITSIMDVVTAIGKTDIVESLTNFVTGLFQGEGEKKNIFEQFTGTIESIQTLFTALQEHPIPNLDMEISDDTVSAFGQLFEIVKAVGKSSVVTAVANFIRGKESFEAFKTDVVTLSEALIAYKENIAQFEKIEVSEGAMKNAKDLATGISDFAKQLPTNAKSLLGRITGVQDLGDFSADIEAFAKAMFTWATYTSDFPTYDEGTKSNAIKAAEGLRDFAATLTDDNTGTIHYGLFGWLTAEETQVTKFADNVTALATAMNAFAGIGEFSNDADLAITALGKIADISVLMGTGNKANSLDDFAEDMVRVFGSRSGTPEAKYDLIGAINNLNNGLIIDTNKVGSVAVALKNIAEAAATLNSAGITDMSSAGSNLAQILTSFIDAGGFTESGVDLAQKLVEGIVSELKNSMTTGTSIKNAAGHVKTFLAEYVNGTGSTSPFYQQGKNVTYGFANGMRDTAALATLKANARWLGSQALKALQERIDSNSPSKEFMKIGGYSAQGYAEGLDSYGSTIGRAAASMGQDALESAKNSLGLFSMLLTDGVDDQPTIRPVLDLSNVTAGAERLNGMLAGQSFNIAGNVAAGLLPNQLYTERGRSSGTSEVEPFDPTGVINSINGINEHLSALDSHMSNLKVVMNSGALVGQIVGDMDKALGKRSLKSNVAL